MSRTNRVVKNRRLEMGVREHHDWMTVSEVAEVMNRTPARMYQLMDDHPNFRECWREVCGSAAHLKLCSCRKLEQYLEIPRKQRDPVREKGEVKITENWISGEEAARRLGLAGGRASVTWLLDNDRGFASCAYYVGGVHLIFDAYELEEYAKTRVQRMKKTHKWDDYKDQLARAKIKKEEKLRVRSEAARKGWEKRKQREENGDY